MYIHVIIWERVGVYTCSVYDIHMWYIQTYILGKFHHTVYKSTDHLLILLIETCFDMFKALKHLQ